MGLLKIRNQAEQRCSTHGLDGTERGGSKILPWFKYETKSSQDFRLPQSGLECPLELAADCSGRKSHSGKSTVLHSRVLFRA